MCVMYVIFLIFWIFNIIQKELNMLKPYFQMTFEINFRREQFNLNIVIFKIISILFALLSRNI